MRSEAVLDASALIALLWEEPGAGAVEELLGRAVVSAVNLSEVIQRYHAIGLDVRGRRDDIVSLGVEVEQFGHEDAEVAADLWLPTREGGLSLADRACLALAHRLDLEAYTADKAWRKVDIPVEIVLIR